MPKTLTFFALNSPDGRALQKMLIPLIDKEYQWAIETDKTINTFMHACNHNDIVILDATIEKDGLNNYSRVSLHPATMNNVLVVSRSYLPMNYVPFYEGGVPQFPYPYAELDDTTFYVASNGKYSNETIIRWLREKLPMMRSRSNSEKSFLGSFKTMNISLNEQIQERKNRGQVFISYRSKGIKEIGYEPAIEPSVSIDDMDIRGTGRLVKNLVELKKHIRAGLYHSGTSKNAFFMMPGSLAYPGELLTKFRRWQVLSIIENSIRSAEEFWIYDTEGYIDSWWTQGELVLWAFLRTKKLAPRLRIYDYRTDTLKDPPSNYVPSLTKKQYHTVDRLCANTSPETMSADTAEETFRKIATMPILGNFPYFNDPVWSKNFWTYLLLQCACSYQTSLLRTFDIENFFSIQEPIITPEQLTVAVQTGKLICPNSGCGRQYKITTLPARYRWVPVRGGKFVKASENALDVYPTYRAIQID